MSDVARYPEDVAYPRRGVGNHWSLKKIVEDVTGKKLEDLQEKKARPKARADEPEPPSLPQFLPQERKPLFATLPADMLENVPFINDENTGRAKVPQRELERKYLLYLMMHMENLTEPALRYLRQAVEDECKERGMH
jgi:hypothetical protein